MACPTLECVLRPNACEINRPASTVFCRSTPCEQQNHDKKRARFYQLFTTAIFKCI